MVEDPAAEKYAKENEEKNRKLPEPANNDFMKVMKFIGEHGEVLQNELMPKMEAYYERFRAKQPPNPKSDPAAPEKKRLNDILMSVIIETQSIDEVFWRIEDEIEKAENPNAEQLNTNKILKQTWRNIKRYHGIVIYYSLVFLFSSLISNEMIVYPAPIRLGFFLFTLFVCMVIKPVIFLLGFYFLCKKGYDYYINELMWQEGMPKEIIMTTLFAFLPLTTNESEGRIKNFFMKPFQYGGQFSQKDGEELAKRMEMYEEDLREAFPYLEKIKNKEPFAPRLEKITTQLKTLHDFVVLPDSDDESEEEAEEAGTNGSPPLPPTIASTMAAPAS